jgi:hypothetical protein
MYSLERLDQRGGRRQNGKTASASTIRCYIARECNRAVLRSICIDVGCSLLYKDDPMYSDLLGGHRDLQRRGLGRDIRREKCSRGYRSCMLLLGNYHHTGYGPQSLVDWAENSFHANML